MSTHLLVKVLSDTFRKEVGKFQESKDGKHQALLVTFSKRLDYDKEDGYRNLDLLVYAPFNYVQVYWRERFDVCPLGLLEGDEDTYTSGKTPWVCLADHDSGWTEGIEQFFREHQSEITGFSGSHFYQVVNAKEYQLP